MSATVFYRKVSKRKDLSLQKTLAPSSFIEIIQTEFGFPCTLNAESIPIIRGMAAGAPGQREAFEELIKVIDDNGEIYLYAEY